MKIRKGDILTIKPEWQDPGDEAIEFLALESESGGRLRITPLGTGLMFPGNQVVEAHMVAATGQNAAKVSFKLVGNIVAKKKASQ